MIPVTVLGGYLGAGKTTLINALLRNPGGRRLAVLVNDFGDIGIDADLIVAGDDEVLELAGGCVCCSFGSDLVGALLELPQRRPDIDQVLIETSGVALPRSVAQTVSLVGRHFVLDAIIVMADAETVRERARDRYVADTVQAQLAQADLVVVSKLDLVEAQVAAELDAWLATAAPRARVVHAVRGAVPVELVLGLGRLADGAEAARPGVVGAEQPQDAAPAGLFAPISEPGDGPALRPLVAHAEQHFVSASFETDRLVDLAALSVALVEPALGVIRAKGLLRDLDGTSRSLQLVGSRVEVQDSAHPAPERGRLACIGLRAHFDKQRLAERVGALLD